MKRERKFDHLPYWPKDTYPSPPRLEFKDILGKEIYFLWIVNNSPLLGLPKDKWAELGLPLDNFFGKCWYPCPYVEGNHYLGTLPVAIITNSLEEFCNRMIPKHWFGRVPFINDWEFCSDFSGLDRVLKKKKMSDEEKLHEVFGVGSIQSTIRGHGYNQCILPMDGGGTWELVKFLAPTGDIVVLWTLDWHNK
jgi:hypothetical protein